MDNTFIAIIELLGTLAFAISGIRLAAAKNFDWFGAYVVGLVTAIGGGTVRDLMLDVPVFWMLDGSYLGITAVGLFAVIFFGKYLIRLNRTFFLFDSIGLALFVVVGIQKTELAGYPFWVAITMGTITGSLGGVLRDVFINVEPLIFRKDIYALACVLGGFVYWITDLAGLDLVTVQLLSAASIIAIRFAAVKYHLSVPLLKDMDGNAPNPS